MPPGCLLDALLSALLDVALQAPPNLFQCEYKEDATTLKRDVFISDLKARNRVVDGEYCYVVVDDVDTNDPSDDEDGADLAVENLAMEMEASTINAAEAPKRQTWNSQEKQQTLWSPQHETNVPLPMKPLSKQEKKVSSFLRISTHLLCHRRCAPLLHSTHCPPPHRISPN